MHIIILVIYGILLSFAVVRIPIIRKSNIKPLYLIIFFWLRVITAWVHNLMAYRFFPNRGDIWKHFEEGRQMKAELLHTPAVFISKYLRPDVHLDFKDHSIFMFLSDNLFGAINMLLNFISFDNFYINTLLFSFAVFAGSIALYRVFMHAFNNHLLCALPALLLPSVLFWTAPVYKEGLIYLFLGFFLFHWQKQLHTTFTARGIISCLLLLFGLLEVRVNLLAGLLPGLAVWTIAQKTSIKNTVNLAITITAVLVLLLMAGMIDPGLHIFTFLSRRQHEFHMLQGNSRLFLPVLQPNAGSFLQTLPFAVINGFFQPLPGKGGNIIYNFFTAELLIIWALAAMALYTVISKKMFQPVPAFVWLCIILVIIQLLLIGYVVPFAGAIVRYRSLLLPFMMAVALYYLRKRPVFANTCQLVSKQLISKNIHI